VARSVVMARTHFFLSLPVSVYPEYIFENYRSLLSAPPQNIKEHLTPLSAYFPHPILPPWTPLDPFFYLIPGSFFPFSQIFIAPPNFPLKDYSHPLFYLVCTLLLSISAIFYSLPLCLPLREHSHSWTLTSTIRDTFSSHICPPKDTLQRGQRKGYPVYSV